MDYDHHSASAVGGVCSASAHAHGLHQVSPNPTNFTVWYCHVSGEWPSLSKALEVLIADGEKFTAPKNAELYASFFAPSRGVAAALDGRAHRIGARDGAELARSKPGAMRLITTSFWKTPRARLRLGKSEDGVRGIVARLLSQTQAMAQQSLELEKQLQASSSEVAKLRTELDGARREALVDTLTGLGNRKMFDSVLREAAGGAAENGESLSLLLLDVDHFKKFNDEFGHQIGDQVLRVVAVMLGENIKGQDTAVRYGGEEFAIVLPRTAGCDARKLAENIRQRICEKRLVIRKTGQDLGRISVSIGVAEFTSVEPLSEFVQRADRALYAAKQTGRNRVIVAEDLPKRSVMET